MSSVVYDERGRTWHEEQIAAPAWDQIVAAVERLHPFRYPWVWLFIGDTADDAMVDCLTIMGGEGGYWIGLSAGPYEQLRLLDPAKGRDEIKVWTSDQGFADHACHITADRDLVLRIAKHFADTGAPLPEPIWEIALDTLAPRSS
jgi:hypothetical protein